MMGMNGINLNVDYDNLCFLESHLMHEVKRMGVQSFVDYYKSNISEFKKDWNNIDFCFLIALLENLDKSFNYDKTVKLSKWVLNPYDYGDLVDFNEELDLTSIYDCSLPSFRDRGFLYSEIGEAI